MRTRPGNLGDAARWMGQGGAQGAAAREHGGSCRQDMILYAWARTGQTQDHQIGLTLPEGYGYPVGRGADDTQFVSMEMHYENTDRIKDPDTMQEPQAPLEP